METFRFKHHGHLPILSKKTPRSKALESVCLFHSYLPPIATQSRWGEGKGEGPMGRHSYLATNLLDKQFGEGRSYQLLIYLKSTI
jgi:hypothetical protein